MGALVQDPSPSSSPSPSKGGLGSLIPCPWLFDRPAFRRISSLRSRSGPQSCSPLDQAHPLRGSRDFYTRAFLTAGHPTAKSGITTQLSGLLLRRNLHPLGKCCYGLQLRSTGITPLPRYCGPVRHPLVVGRFPGEPVIRPTQLRRFRGGTRRASPVRSTCPSHRAVAHTPPEGIAASASLRRSLLPSRMKRRSASGESFSGLPYVHSRYGPVTRSPSVRWLVDGLQGFGFPPPCHPSYGASGLPPVGLPPTEHVCLLCSAPCPSPKLRPAGKRLRLPGSCRSGAPSPLRPGARSSRTMSPTRSRSTSHRAHRPPPCPVRCPGQELRLLARPELPSPPPPLIR